MKKLIPILALVFICFLSIDSNAQTKEYALIEYYNGQSRIFRNNQPPEEYKATDKSLNELQVVLNKMAAEGWRFVGNYYSTYHAVTVYLNETKNNYHKNNASIIAFFWRYFFPSHGLTSI